MPFFLRVSIYAFLSNFLGRSQFTDLHFGQTLGLSVLSRGSHSWPHLQRRPWNITTLISYVFGVLAIRRYLFKEHEVTHQDATRALRIRRFFLEAIAVLRVTNNPQRFLLKLSQHLC